MERSLFGTSLAKANSFLQAWLAPTARESRVAVDDTGDTRVLVVFRHAVTSLGALRWAIQECRRTGAQLVVLHQAAVAVRVRNGPTAAIAHRIGSPTWATVFATTEGLGAPQGSITVVEPTAESTLVTEWWTPGSQVVVGSRRHARQLRRRLELDAQIITVPPNWTSRVVADRAAERASA